MSNHPLSAEPHASQTQNKSSSETPPHVPDVGDAPTSILLGNGKMITDPDEIDRHIEKED